jgi:hypothetical protein
MMDAEELLNIISECDVLKEDIDEVRERVSLTPSEGSRLAKAAGHVDKAKSALTHLFPTIRSLDENVKEVLAEELSEPDAFMG